MIFVKGEEVVSPHAVLHKVNSTSGTYVRTVCACGPEDGDFEAIDLASKGRRPHSGICADCFPRGDAR